MSTDSPFSRCERLLLREWRAEDLPLFIEMNRDKEVMEYFPKVLTPQESEAFYERIREEFREYGYGLYAVECKESGEFIGYTGFHHANFEADFTPCVEIGWRLMRKAWGKGYATEAAKACLNTKFSDLGFNQVFSFTASINQRSERVMQKAGLQKIGEFYHPALVLEDPLARHVLYRTSLVDKETKTIPIS